MKRHTRFLALLSSLALILTLTSCWLSEEPPVGDTELTTVTDTTVGEPERTDPDGQSDTAVLPPAETVSDVPTETDTPTVSDTTPVTEPESDDPYSGLSDEERAIRAVADEALRAAYDVPAMTHFAVDIDYGSNGNTNIYVSYDLMIQGYRTNEHYRVTLKADRTVESVSGSNTDYACYLEGATAAAIAAAEAKLDGNGSGLYPTIDSDGYLCLAKEVIVSIPYAPETDQNGDVVEDAPLGGTHEHWVYTERICPKP